MEIGIDSFAGRSTPRKPAMQKFAVFCKGL
jgi:hypothetical protein